MRLGWNLLREDLSLPSAVLYRDRLEHNLAWMQRFMDAYKVRLAPHGKTTMAPRLFEMQLKGGAWGITLASAQQTMVAHAHGVERVLMANQLVGKQNMQMIADLLGDPEFEFYCLVDSAAGVNLLGRILFGARAAPERAAGTGRDGRPMRSSRRCAAGASAGRAHAMEQDRAAVRR